MYVLWFKEENLLLYKSIKSYLSAANLYPIGDFFNEFYIIIVV